MANNRAIRRNKEAPAADTGGGLLALLLLGGGALAVWAYMKRDAVVDTIEGAVQAVARFTGAGVASFDASGKPLGLRPYATDLTDPSIWNAVVAPVQSYEGERSPEMLTIVIDQLDVANNPRYAPQPDGSTRCNVFVEDAVRQMGHELPFDHANEIVGWLAAGRDGWAAITAPEAQDRANAGYPVIAGWLNPGGIGHMAMVRPGFITNFGPASANAGAVVFNNKHIADGFGYSRLALVKYFTNG